jgi:hypothetical protein
MNAYTMTMLADSRTAELLREAADARLAKEARQAAKAALAAGQGGASTVGRRSHRSPINPLRWFGAVLHRGSAV